MATRTERCGWCGVQLLVPPGAQSIQCSICRSVTVLQSSEQLISSQDHGHHNSIPHAANKIRDAVLNSAVSSSVTSIHGRGKPDYYGYNYTQPPPMPQALPRPPGAHGRKRALLCGINYYGKSYRLKGTSNDVRLMKYFLIEKMGFPSDCILMLTEEETNPLMIPTKHNMRMALHWLVQGCRPGDSLVFHYSGHGAREVDLNMDEIDGYDEALCPVDYEIQGKLLDDEINATIVRPLPNGVTLHAIIDACHSGTVLDLPYICRMNREGYARWEDQRCPFACYKGTRGGLAISLSACDDNQTSVDTSALSGNAVSTGALTYSFIQAAQNEPGLTYGRLLCAMRRTIREAKAGIVGIDGPIVSLLNRFLGLKITQETQLSSSEKFDIHSKQFVL